MNVKINITNKSKNTVGVDHLKLLKSSSCHVDRIH